MILGVFYLNFLWSVVCGHGNVSCLGSQQVDLISETQSNRHGCPADTLCRGKPISRPYSWDIPTEKGGAKQVLGKRKYAGLCNAQKSATIKHPIYFDNSKNHDTYHPKNILQPIPIRVSLFLDWHSTLRHRRVAAL